MRIRTTCRFYLVDLQHTNITVRGALLAPCLLIASRMSLSVEANHSFRGPLDAGLQALLNCGDELTAITLRYEAVCVVRPEMIFRSSPIVFFYRVELCLLACLMFIARLLITICLGLSLQICT